MRSIAKCCSESSGADRHERPTAQELIAKLGLQPHHEGGWFREAYRSATKVAAPQGARSAVTTIYYLLEHARVSPWHVVQSDELWHFYGGAPAELLSYDPAARTLLRYRLTARERRGRPGGRDPGGQLADDPLPG